MSNILDIFKWPNFIFLLVLLFLFAIFYKRTRKGFILLIIYCFPCIIAISVTLYVSYVRSMKVADEICKKMECVDESKKKEQEDKKEAIEPHNNIARVDESTIIEQKGRNDWLKERFDNFKKERAKDSLKYKKKDVKGVLFNIWFEDALFIVPLTLVPFLFLGYGIAFFKEVREKIRKPPNKKKLEEKELDSEMRRIAFKDTVMKYIVSFIVIYGLLYCFNPYGIGATKVYGFILTEEPISANTVPIFFEIAKSPIKHVLAGFWGWYLYLLWYLFYKFYRKDLISTRFYSVLFKKFLFVVGIALILSTVSKDAALVLLPAFLIGFFPLSAFSILKDFGFRISSNSGEQTISLSKLPGISRWEILRLEEEGVESITSLATADRAQLKRVLPIRETLIDLWINTAVLMTLVGARKYECLKEICLTADNFLKQFKDGRFRKFLREKCSIYNPNEIAKLIKERFNV